MGWQVEFEKKLKKIQKKPEDTVSWAVEVSHMTCSQSAAILIFTRQI